MKALFQIIKYDYLQRTRSYAFLITLCASLAIAYTFVPEPNANYSTIRIGGYVGYYNAAWFGYVTATMTTIFLSLFGFYLVNDGIKKDFETKIGQVVASTYVSNFKYLIAKVISNFLVLASIVGIIFLMSILLFFLYNDGYSFELLQFIKPYSIIVLPTMFSIAVLAVLLEVVLAKYSILQNVIFFFLFAALMIYSPKNDKGFALDFFGNKEVIHQMESTVKDFLKTTEDTGLTIGYVLGNIEKSNKFLFEGVEFSNMFLASRLAWVVIGIPLILCLSLIFHRFDLKEKSAIKSKKHRTIQKTTTMEVIPSKLVTIANSFSLFPILKTELLLMLRQGKRWLWLINIAGMIALVLAPIKITHQILLPILWFLQVGRISKISIKEQIHHTSQYMFATYKPIRRLFTAQLGSTIILMICLALPLIVKLLVTGSIL